MTPATILLASVMAATSQPAMPATTQPAARDFTVQATREGLIGRRTATGHVITPTDIFVALPDRSALNRTVAVSYNGKTISARVLDVGPWNTTDPYWRAEGVPAAARGVRMGRMARYGPPKNKAGIDLSDGLWDAFGENRAVGVITVTWRFLP